ncbi:4-hydroxythreonine-4-phosphate dehydrogenase PdxA [Coralloluteibacterium stylophorae]|uniref:4-hydroxythreonine-4-phosphate dehydrogenase PdxA n=1 Tax=Coralloluteibacterium stylophorae TaxID=1776034 RepID=UPI003083F993
MTRRLALVPGEPAGVGPELCVRLAQDARDHDLVAFADPATLEAAADLLGLPLRLSHDGAPARAPATLAVHAVPQARTTRFGEPDPANAPAVVQALTAAADACLRGDCHGLVTGPTHKATINAAGIPYVGTTELLAAHAGCEVVMMLATVGAEDADARELRVALATTHLPLRAVADAVTGAGLETVLRTVDASLRSRFGIVRPRIAVLGLNPHAGEDGHLGREEIEVIAPALRRLREEGLLLEGPLPADTAFLPHRLARCDAVLAMYHDQGLPVLKFAGFERAVNITLGLPYPRVAVDHGTALDLAGRGVADVSSLRAAHRLCARLAGAARG